MAKQTTQKRLSGRQAVNKLHSAAKKKDYAAMYDVLACAPDLPVGDRKVLEAFMATAFSEDLSLVQAFVDRGIDINTEANGHRMLVLAAASPDTQFFNGLLKLDADVNLPGTNDATPLIMAASTAARVSDPEILLKRVKDLVKRGADVNAKDVTDRTALDYAFGNESVEVAQLLIKLGAKLKTCIGRGWQCLEHALDASDDALLKLALQAGANPNWPLFGKKNPPVNYAAEEGMESKVKLLIKAGAKKTLPDDRDAVKVAREKAREKAAFREDVFELLERAEALQARLKKIASQLSGIRPDHSFLGETGYFLGKTPCFCPSNDSLLVRLGRPGVKASLKQPGVSPFEHNRRNQPEWVCLAPEQIASDKQLKAWVNQAVVFVKARNKK